MTNWELIAKYLVGEASDNEKKEVEQWINSNPVNSHTIDNLKKAMRPGYSNEPDFNDTLGPDWHVLQDKIGENNSASKNHVRMLPLWIKIAATLLIGVLAGVGSWYAVDNLRSVDQKIVALDSVKNVLLPDGTHVWLNRSAQLTVSKDFGKQDRNVILKGEGYFEVSKDKPRPFIITTGNIKTRVVGTAFNVRDESNGSVKVTVTEGKVSVSKDSTLSVFLIPNEVASYDALSGDLWKKQNADINFLSWKTNIIRFSNTSLHEVCSYLNQYYRTDIRLKGTSLQNQNVTTVFDHVNLEQALSILSLTLDLKIEKEGSTFYLSR
jgi:transmembrane sensor